MIRPLKMALALMMLAAVCLATASVVQAQRATPEATPVGGPVVGSYGEISEEYEAAEQRLLDLGRQAVTDLETGEIDRLVEQFTPEMEAAVSADELTAHTSSLETDRVHFEMAPFGIVFDGHLDGGSIEGFFYQGITLGFSLERVDDSAGMIGPVGDWAGTIEGEGLSIGIEVNLEETDGKLSGSISIPEQGLTAFELETVWFAEELPLGDVIDESAMPLRRDEGFYAVERVWGDATLVITMGFNSHDEVAGLFVEPHWPLPEDPAAGYETDQVFALPFDGAWWVFWGGDTQLRNYHVTTPVQRHAYDLVIWNEGGTARGDGLENGDFWVWGQPVFSPASGEVVSAVDGIADNVPGAMNPSEPAGNHVVIRTGIDEYLFLAHFMEGSIVVAEGDMLEMGDFVGLTGNSGNSSEPHLHIHLQDGPELLDPSAQGLPLEFSGYVADGNVVDSGVPQQGQFVERE